MKYVKLGNTGIQVSRICIGCMSFGEPSKDFLEWTLDYESSKAMIKRSLELGVNFFDTANTYSHGTSEEFLGRALKELGVKREDVVIATKVFFNEGKLSKEAIFREVEALNELVKQGKVRAIGASAMYGYQFHNMQVIAEKHGWAKFSTMQNHYNLLYREDEREMIPVCKQYGVTLIPYSPLAAGHLCRPTWEGDSKRSQTDKFAKGKYDHAKENDMEIVKVVETIAKEHNVSMTEIALAWLFAKGANPIVGISKPHHLDDAVKSLDVELSEEDIRRLEEHYLPHKIVGAI